MSAFEEVFAKDRGGFSGDLLFNEPLSRHTYYRIGGPASLLAVPKSVNDLVWLADRVRREEVPYFFLGAGSNCLASDFGFPGVVVKTGRIDLGLLPLAGGVLRAGGSVAISSLLRRASQEGWGGLEFLSGIPGSVGGAVRMNAGTHLGETASSLSRVVAFGFGRAEVREYSGTELRFEYRRNLFLPDDALVIGADWKYVPGEPASVKAAIDSVLQRRKQTQPLEAPSCGSVFKNPKTSSGPRGGTELKQAWQVIDRLGLRGLRIGGAQISEKHSNWILNTGAAKASDVLALIELAKKRAQEELGVQLEEEVVWLGAAVTPPYKD